MLCVNVKYDLYVDLKLCMSLEIGIRQFARNSILSDNPMTKSYYLVLIGNNNVNSV